MCPTAWDLSMQTGHNTISWMGLGLHPLDVCKWHPILLGRNTALEEALHPPQEHTLPVALRSWAAMTCSTVVYTASWQAFCQRADSKYFRLLGHKGSVAAIQICHWHHSMGTGCWLFGSMGYILPTSGLDRQGLWPGQMSWQDLFSNI